jgi:predicted ABC-type ATPase
VILHDLELPSADDAVARVARRVWQGGHDIPEADIRRRFERSRRMLEEAYRPVVDETRRWRSDEGRFHAID